jgi:hypothetical protein
MTRKVDKFKELNTFMQGDFWQTEVPFPGSNHNMRPPQDFFGKGLPARGSPAVGMQIEITHGMDIGDE